MNTLFRATFVLAGLCPALAHAQFTIDWFTIDGGGGSTSGGAFTIDGCIGQPDAGTHTGGTLQIAGGFLAGIAPVCYANCDLSTTPPTLNVQDFSCFLNQFAAADARANCDSSTTPPVLNVQDFSCFLNRFAAGCP